MGFKFNPTTGELDLVNAANSTPGNYPGFILTSTIPALATAVSDQNAHATFSGINYRIFAASQDGSKYKILNCFVSKIGSNTFDQVAFKVGDLQFSVQNNITAGYHELSIENFETQPINITIQKEIF